MAQVGQCQGLEFVNLQVRNKPRVVQVGSNGRFKQFRLPVAVRLSHGFTIPGTIIGQMVEIHHHGKPGIG
jgi:hypothetical protein